MWSRSRAGTAQIALRLTRLLSAGGDQVIGLIRDPAQSDEVRAAGAEPVVCDLEGDCDARRGDRLGGGGRLRRRSRARQR